jgi:ABC-2 type transport system ATP-binding protein
MMKMEALTVENLSKIYSNGKGIREVNLNVEKGKIHALLGNNGAG